MVYSHLIRRGVAVLRDGPPNHPHDMPPHLANLHEAIQEIPAWGFAFFAVTALACVVILAFVRYTLQSVVTTLAMIEEPQTTVIVRDEKSPLKFTDGLAEESIDTDVLVIKQIPITSSIRGTIRHLDTIGGAFARWRGFSALLVWAVSHDFLKNLFMNVTIPLTSPWLAGATASVLSRVLLARIGLTWTHIVISAPSAQPWFKRVPSRSAWRQVALPTLYNALAWQLSYLLPAAVAHALDFTPGPHVSQMDAASAHCTAMKLLAVGAIALVTFVGITIPSEVALTRVQASLLSSQDEPIVSFDRTFAGAVVPQANNGPTKALGFMQAWRTFDGAARVRLLKLLVKVFAVDVFAHIFVVLVLVGQFFFLIGPKGMEMLTRDTPFQDDRAWERYEAVVQ